MSFTNIPPTERTENDVIEELARQAAKPHPVVPGEVYAVTDRGGVHHVLDLEHLLENPRRKTGRYQPATIKAFSDYVVTHAGLGTSIWIDRPSASITAIIDDHTEHTPGWGNHRATVALQRTPEWKHWLAADGHYVGQEAFAEHLQDGIEEIRVPDAATMLEIAQSIQGRTNADWKTGTRLDNGEVQFAYQEEVQAGAGRSGQLEVPQEFELAVAPFYGEQPAPITARLRYRIKEGVLRIGYKLNRPDDLELQILGEIETRLSESFTHVYQGTPPA
jgi:uncharacterized protein YfdQ (DUF2303 family)